MHFFLRTSSLKHDDTTTEKLNRHLYRSMEDFDPMEERVGEWDYPYLSCHGYFPMDEAHLDDYSSLDTSEDILARLRKIHATPNPSARLTRNAEEIGPYDPEIKERCRIVSHQCLPIRLIADLLVCQAREAQAAALTTTPPAPVVAQTAPDVPEIGSLYPADGAARVVRVVLPKPSAATPDELRAEALTRNLVKALKREEFMAEHRIEPLEVPRPPDEYAGSAIGYDNGNPNTEPIQDVPEWLKQDDDEPAMEV